MAIMPVTPLCCAVAFDDRFIEGIGDCLSTEDGSLLNHYQVVHSYECLFAPTELVPEQRTFVRQQWKERTTDFGYIDYTVWVPNLIALPPGDPFTFLKRTNVVGA